MRIIELRHVEPEGPAAYLPALERFGEVTTVRLWTDPLPTAEGWDAAIVMGGPMGANDGATVPWIDDEIRFVQSLLARDVPIWGVCLGAQLLAAALGARVWTGERPEVGVLDLGLTAAGRRDPVWGDLPATFPALHWHGDSFDLPDGAELLASSAAYPNQLFRAGRCYGVQFHLEVDAPLAAAWLDIDEYRIALEQTRGDGAAADLLADVQAVSERTAVQAGQAMQRWLTSVATLEAPGRPMQRAATV